MAELRAISTRAKITPTRFWNEYHWGNLKADPASLVERYFDAHLYFASWGTHRLILRLPQARVDVPALIPYFVGDDAARLDLPGEHVLLDLTSETDEPKYDDESEEALAALSPLRAELMRGDLRPAYLAWLLALQTGDVGDEDTEPPVPAGLANLTAAQQALVELLRIDADLLAAAASGTTTEPASGDDHFRAWVTRLPQEQKDRWLLRAVEDPDLALGGELLRTFRASEGQSAAMKRRTAGDLHTLTEAQRAERVRAETTRATEAREAAARERQHRLDKLGRDSAAAWVTLETLVETSAYDRALALAIDLRDLATRDGDAPEFAKRFEAMRKRQLRRRGFFDRWKLVGVPPVR